jgi:very-short-patch-repair endonuclease
VHSHKMDKREVIKRLMQSLLYTQPDTASMHYKTSAQELKQLRESLNAYVRQMHEARFEIGLSPYVAMGRLAKLLDAVQVNFAIPEIERISPSALGKMVSIVHELATYSRIIRNYKTDRWTGCKEVTSSLQEREMLASTFEATARGIRDLQNRVQKITTQYGLPLPTTIQDCADYVEVMSAFYPGIFSPAVQDSISNYVSDYRSFWRYFRPQYWRDSGKLQPVYRTGTRPEPAAVVDVLQIVRKILGRSVANHSTIVGFAATPPDVSELPGRISSISSGLSIAKGLFNNASMPIPLSLGFNQEPSALADWFIDHGNNTQQLAEWANFNATAQEAVEAGIGEFVSLALNNGLSAENWERAFERRFYLLLTDSMVGDRPILQKFRGALQSEMVQRFRSLDLQMVENAPYEIRSRLNANKPRSSWTQASSAETTILRREYNKKRRVMPLRKLFAQIPELIQALKPCLMMSPLTVCQLLEPAHYRFDLVVFDEASQIPPEYAMGAFLRAKQVIVAGDRQQLPPTNFFHAIEADELDDDDESTGDESFESILNSFDSCGLPSLMLNWHYRSKDESLIAYSNYHFYDNRLYTFPSSGLEDETTGLKFVFIKDGVYKRGVGARHNLKEAMAVANLVREHFMKSPELSLGIVAFSVSQRQAISDAIDLMLKENPDLAPLRTANADEPLFVKNLENVQGDERDVIILSVGYAKDEAGKMTLNFGPINRDGGARRLNVAVTRARYSLKVVASIEPEDIDLGRVESQGAILLRNYLEVARDGAKAAFKDEKRYADAEFDSPFEASVYQALTQRGIQLVPQLGVSQYRIDFAVLDPKQTGRYLLGIECDGAMYHSAATARDRDRLRQQVLEGLG